MTAIIEAQRLTKRLGDRPGWRTDLVSRSKEANVTANFKLDMTMMYAYHDALRRDLARVAHLTARPDGWDLFERFLHVHHDAEDGALWPALREALISQTEDLPLLDEMEAEHAALRPLLEAIDDALDSGESAPEARAGLAARLEEHLTHEEEAALPVIDRTLDEEQWMQFGEASAARIGPDMPTFLPWLLEGADDDRTKAILGGLPEPAQQAYRNEWQPAHAAKNWWAT
jgi:Hemerythrin HHE cation binding domain